jgi:hypothetical protein
VDGTVSPGTVRLPHRGGEHTVAVRAGGSIPAADLAAVTRDLSATLRGVTCRTGAAGALTVDLDAVAGTGDPHRTAALRRSVP